MERDVRGGKERVSWEWGRGWVGGGYDALCIDASGET